MDFGVWPIFAPENIRYPAKGEVFGEGSLGEGDRALKVEYIDFRKFNILNLSSDGTGKPKNVGPNVTYKLRDARGQAKEYVNYMQPLRFDGRDFFVTGMRATPQDEFRYLRIPVDDAFGIDGFMAFRATMLNPEKQNAIAKKLGAFVMQNKAGTERDSFETSAQKLLSVFAEGGYDKITEAIEKSVPEAERGAAAKAYIKMLGLAAFEAYNMGMQELGHPMIAPNEKSETLILDSLSAFSDLFYFGAPYYFQLEDYQHLQASGFQLTKSPGQFWVYLGSCLLVLGIFAMLYIKERRIWLLLKPEVNQIRFAMSSNRKNLDFEQEFSLYQNQLEQLVQ